MNDVMVETGVNLGLVAVGAAVAWNVPVLLLPGPDWSGPGSGELLPRRRFPRFWS